MEFRVGQITAKCVKCEGTVFEEQRQDVRRGQTAFSCASCKAVMSYSEVIMQIGRQASHRTRERMAQARAAMLQEKAAQAANEPAADATLIGTTTVPAALMLIMRGAKASQ